MLERDLGRWGIFKSVDRCEKFRNFVFGEISKTFIGNETSDLLLQVFDRF